MNRILTDRRWWIAGAALLVLLVVVLIATANGGSTSTSPATDSPTPAGAQVLEVGAISGPNGSALLNARTASLTALDVQFLQFGDEASIPAALAAGTGDAAILPESVGLADGQEVIAKLYTVESGGTPGLQVLVAPKDSPLKADLQTLAKALQSQATIEYLNSLDGVKVSKAG